ncbi:ORF55L [Turbot reddish body iridovirus]|uniref:ORF55L n=1 Tax=Turbot reddish body iridovirus TaxID=273651 RepID=E2CU00_ISKNV|nr:ORF55L [Turbot reddish body iridovirus]
MITLALVMTLMALGPLSTNGVHARRRGDYCTTTVRADIASAISGMRAEYNSGLGDYFKSLVPHPDNPYDTDDYKHMIDNANSYNCHALQSTINALLGMYGYVDIDEPHQLAMMKLATHTMQTAMLLNKCAAQLGCYHIPFDLETLREAPPADVMASLDTALNLMSMITNEI